MSRRHIMHDQILSQFVVPGICLLTSDSWFSGNCLSNPVLSWVSQAHNPQSDLFDKDRQVLT